VRPKLWGVGNTHTIVSDKLLDLSLRGHLERIREHLRQVFIAAPAEFALADPNEEKGGDENGTP
jgi:hypothetical protein